MLNYVLGIVTPMLLVALWLILGELTSRNLEKSCYTCNRVFGILSTDAVEGQKPSLTYVTKFKFWVHKFGCK